MSDFSGDDDLNIDVLPSVEAIRRRPRMYIGADNADATDLVFEAMCLALAEAACGSVSAISVLVEGLHIRITDDGNGISLEPDKQGVPFAQRAMTEIGACRDHKEHVRLKQELCEFGLVVVNALSSAASVTSGDGKTQQRQTYTAGVANGPFGETGTGPQRGTVLEFHLDPRFIGQQFDETKLWTLVDELPIDLQNLSLTVDHSVH